MYSNSTIIHSVPKLGVSTTGNNWWDKKKCTGVEVTTTSDHGERATSNWAYEQIGKPYNYEIWNTNTRSKFYCSQLVWAGYYDLHKENLDTVKYNIKGTRIIHPSEFVNNPITVTVYEK